MTAVPRERLEKTLARVAREHGPDLIDPAISGLEEMALPITSPVRCLTLNEQVAQKLHACTGPASAGRARDILDIFLIDLLGGLDCSQTRIAVQRVFSERATHELPIEFPLPAGWTMELETLAADLQLPITDKDEISVKFRELFAQLRG